MASPREPKGSTKVAVPAPIEQKSQRTRNSTRPPPVAKNSRKFDAQVSLDTIGEGRKALLFPKKQTIFAQGVPADSVFYLQTGKVRLTVVSKNGKEATLGILSDRSFFGEGSLAGQPLRMGSATAMTDCAVLRIEKKAMVDALHREHTLSDLFVAYAGAASGVRVFPLDRPSIGGVCVDVASEFTSQVGNRGEDTAGDNPAFDLGEPNLDLVEPG